MAKFFFCFFLVSHIVAAQEFCKPTIEVEHTDFRGKPKDLKGIILYLMKANGSKTAINFGKSTVSLMGTGLQFESQNREFYFPFSADSSKDVCIDYNLKYVYQTEDSLGALQKIFLSLEYVDKGETFFLCNEKIDKGVKENLLNKSVFETIKNGPTYVLVYKQPIADIREHLRDLRIYTDINLNKINNPFEDEFTIEIPNLIPFQSAMWGSDSFAYRFTKDPRVKEDYSSELYIYNDWNHQQSSLHTKSDSTYQGGKLVYFGISDSGLYWKYYYYKNFGVGYADVRKEDLDLFEHALSSFRVGNEIDKTKLKVEK